LSADLELRPARRIASLRSLLKNPAASCHLGIGVEKCGFAGSSGEVTLRAAGFLAAGFVAPRSKVPTCSLGAPHLPPKLLAARHTWFFNRLLAKAEELAGAHRELIIQKWHEYFG